MILIFVKVSCSACSLFWNVVLRIFSEDMWMDPLASAMIIVRGGGGIQPLFLISYNRGAYLLIFCCILSSKK